MTSVTGFTQSGAFGRDLFVESSNGGSLLLELVVGGCPGPEVILLARRVAGSGNKEDAVRVEILFQMLRVAWTGELLHHLGGSASCILADEFELILMPGHRTAGSLALQLLAQADKVTLAGSRMNEDMGVQVIGVMMKAIAVTDRVAGMEFLLQGAHGLLNDPA